jgi:peptidoglycan/LPS O-acetylase OafA/YrhL
MENAKPRLFALDLLRIFAAYWVLFHHWTSTGGFLKDMKMPYEVPELPRLLHALLHPGFLGVDIFFILSGIVISRSALDRSWEKFASARFLRLYPAYLLATVAAIALAPLTINSYPPLSQLWLSLTGLQWFFGYPTIVGPAWTLFIEIRFYILIAVVLAILGRCSRPQLMAFARLWLVGIILIPSLKFEWLNFILLGEYGCYFVLGMVVGLCRNREDMVKNLPTIAVAMIVSWLRMQLRLSEKIPDMAVDQIVSAIILLCVMAAAYFAIEAKAAKSTILDRSVVTLALATYPIYLFHEPLGMPLIGWLRSYGFGFWGAMAIAFVATTAFAILCAKAIEPSVGRAVKSAFTYGSQAATPS